MRSSRRSTRRGRRCANETQNISGLLAIVLVIAGCVLRFAMPGHDFLGYALWGIAVLVFLWARLHRVGRIVLGVLVCAGADRVRGL